MTIPQQKPSLVSATSESLPTQTQLSDSTSLQRFRYVPQTAFAKSFFRLNSIGSKLFLAVMGGTLVGVSGMSYFFYQTLEQQGKEKIQGALNYQVASVQGQLTEVERSTADIASSINILRRTGTKDPAIYKDLAFEHYRKRVSLTMGVGFGQLPNQIVPSLKYYYPYFYTVKGFPDAAGTGQVLPAPYTDIRYSELFKDDSYQDKEYFKIPIAARKKFWVEPFDWHGISMTSFVYPFFDDQGKLLGVTDNDVNVTALSEQVKGSVFRGAGYFAILSEKGNLLAYPVNPEKAKTRESYQRLPELEAIWSKLQQGQSGLVEAGGNFWAYQRIPNTNWLMLAAVPQSVVLGPVLAITLVTTLGAGVVLALVVALFVRQLNRRLQPILHECNKLAAEDAATQAQMQGQDEIGRLSTSFFNLLEQLAINQEQIRREADERRLKQALVQQESEVLQADVSHILDVVSAVEGGDLTVQAQVSDRATGLVADTFNRLLEQLGQVLAQVLATAQQVSAGSATLEELAKTVATNATQQAQGVAQVLRLTEQVEHSAQSSAQKVNLTNRSLLDVSSVVEQGQTAIENLTKGIEVLQQGTDRIVQRMKTLGEFVGLADHFVQEQGQIASLTQVLALNATLVAARASEQRDPRQFLVVAREFEAIATQVSTLAKQTNDGLESLQQRTTQIHTVVSAIDADIQSLGGLVSGFTKGVEQSNQVFGNVQTVTGEVVQAGQEVTVSSQEIVNATQSTAKTMHDIADLAERTADLTQNTRWQSEQMETLSRQLLSNIQFFRLPVAATPGDDTGVSGATAPSKSSSKQG